MASDESVVTPSKYDMGVVLDERKCMSMEISKHGVTAPASNDSNFIGVNATEEQSHGSAGPKGSSGNVVRVEASVARNGEGSSRSSKVIKALNTERLWPVSSK